MKSLEDPETVSFTNLYGYNVGIYAAVIGYEEVVLKALDFKEQRDVVSLSGSNLLSLCKEYNMEKAYEKAERLYAEDEAESRKEYLDQCRKDYLSEHLGDSEISFID